MTALAVALGQLTLAPPALVGLHEVPMPDANELLERWGHYLGACRRPFGQQGWVLLVGDRPVAVAVSASTVAATTAGYRRDQLVELARLCACERWATRVMLRLWREVAAPAWPHWPVAAAVAYSQNDRHEGRIYRFDGWTRISTRAGTSGGGGTWTTPRPGCPECISCGGRAHFELDEGSAWCEPCHDLALTLPGGHTLDQRQRPLRAGAARAVKTLWLWRYQTPPVGGPGPDDPPGPESGTGGDLAGPHGPTDPAAEGVGG